ncbi:MAG: universal stress protein [Micropruina sp.]|uniref:universal stress protein n=1 Tax=Micropruina sp. TaxID=2737536 RepID=UPI0039E50843
MKWKNLVVGVDGSQSSRAALQWAYDVALAQNAELTALMTWRQVTPPPAGSASTYNPEFDDADQASIAEKELLSILREELGEDPGVLVRPRVVAGRAAKELIDASHDADLLVVGSRGIGGFAGMLLGSVSQHVAAHAACTVVVVRTPGSNQGHPATDEALSDSDN